MFYNIWIASIGKVFSNGKGNQNKSGQFMDKFQDGQKFKETYGLY